jgi:DNA-binding MarR family transcriptional regulator
MNIWVEYFKRVEPIKNNQAQMRENLKWDPPDSKDIQRRFCQTREEAVRYAKSLEERGYHTVIKTDGPYSK